MSITITTLSSVFLSGTAKTNLWLGITILVPAILMSIVGLIDDVRSLSPWSRFLFQKKMALISTALLIQGNTVGSPSGSVFLDVCISIFWIVGLTNAVNFFDNLDGGASTTILITSIMFAALAFFSSQFLLSALSTTIAGALFGFLIWNRPPARIYMGDAGALFLGMLIASLTLRLDTLPLHKFAGFMVPVLLVAVPIIDTSVAVISRLSKGLSPFQGGRDHLAHRLMSLGLSKRQTVFVISVLTTYFSSLALVLSFSPYDWELFIAFLGGISILIIFWVFFKSKFKIS
jgi:UDP-GlcNAc:undecaprenyl-phosphate GlcNAc-1-phosphate transferase